jgi:hypothetical protein
MSTKHLPQKPDFLALETAALATTEQRTIILALIGDLNFSWSNTESMFIYIIMLLLETDDVSAAIVFSTLNTTRSRLDLVRRLSSAKITNLDVQEDIEKLISQFDKTTSLRNDLNHATFVFNKEGQITHTQSLKLKETKGQIQFGMLRSMDDKRLDEIRLVVNKLKSLNRDIWDILPRIELQLKTTGHII